MIAETLNIAAIRAISAWRIGTIRYRATAQSRKP
jgi:hypothetical protein